jgi:hypothetical protein
MSGKGKAVKKTTLDRFNDNRAVETRRLDAKRKMDHDERMASMRLKRHKYELKYGANVRMEVATSSAAATGPGDSREDKEIQILRLKIRLEEIKQASASQMQHSPALYSEGSSTPSTSSGYTIPQAGPDMLPSVSYTNTTAVPELNGTSGSSAGQNFPVVDGGNYGGLGELRDWQGDFFTG